MSFNTSSCFVQFMIVDAGF